MERKWYLVDATDKVLGRLATQVSILLRGKNRPDFSLHEDKGNFVVVINAEKVKLTGKKWENKIYYRHSGYIGGLKEIKAKDLLLKHPERLIIYAVSGMLPKNKLRAKFLKRLKVYKGPEHPHKAQKPEKIEL